MPAPPLAGRTTLWVGIGINALYLAVAWMTVPLLLDVDPSSGVVFALRSVFLLSFAAQVAGAIRVLQGDEAGGALWVAWGSVLFLAPGVVSLYGARVLRNDAVRRDLLREHGGTVPPNAAVSLTKMARQQQVMGTLFLGLGVVMLVIGIGGGLVLSAGVLQIAGSRYLRRHPQAQFYDTFLVWAPLFVRKPVAVPYREVEGLQTGKKGLTVEAGARTFTVQKGTADPDELDALAHTLRTAAGLPT